MAKPAILCPEIFIAANGSVALYTENNEATRRDLLKFAKIDLNTELN